MMPRLRRTASTTAAGLATLATAVALAAPATAGGSFNSKLCALFPASALAGADLDAPCLQLPTKHTPLYLAAYTANWGKLRPGRDQHFLGFQGIKPTAAYLARYRKALPQTAAGWEKIPNGYENVEPNDSGDAKGFAGMATRVVNGYICNVTFVDRSAANAPTKDEFQGTLFLIAQFCNKVK